MTHFIPRKPGSSDTPLSDAGRRAFGQYLFRTYGLMEWEYTDMLEAQDGRCAMCGRAGKLVVDHDHVTGRVRGLLDNFCNLALGILENSVLCRNGRAYLLRGRAADKPPAVSWEQSALGKDES